MAGDILLVIDAGTTSTRAMLFSPDGRCLGVEQTGLTQSWPRSGWVEHDGEEIADRSFECAASLVERAGGADRIAGIGITNQRETILFWSRRTGRPFGPAIVWQDRRTADLCARLQAEGKEALVQDLTGLLLDPYFSASKIAWAMANWPQLAEAGDDLAIGTVESLLIWRLTGGLHISDATNASRTALMDIEKGRWSEALCDLFAAPRRALPEIVDCAGRFGETRAFGGSIPICGMAGDQQAAAIGQACLAPGDTKATYGTGAFILTQAGPVRPSSGTRLLSTIAWQLDGVRFYALEGSVFVAGSLIKWVRDELGLVATSQETAAIAAGLADNGGVYVVPAHCGLGAPHWQPEARAAISGLSLGTGRAHIVRASLEAMAHQTHDLMTAFAADGSPWQRLKIDGGMAANDWLAQDLADMLRVEVERPAFVETTALGAAMLAAVGCGLHPDLGAAAAMRGPVEAFSPHLADELRAERLAGWQRALAPLISRARS